MAQEEVGIVDPKANLITLLSDEAVSERLKSRQKERTRSWEVGDSEADVRDRHLPRNKKAVNKVNERKKRSIENTRSRKD